MVQSSENSLRPHLWVAWAERLVSEIRNIRPTGFVVVGGIDWAFDLRHVKVRAPNIVYSTHIYANRQPNHGGRRLEMLLKYLFLSVNGVGPNKTSTLDGNWRM